MRAELRAFLAYPARDKLLFIRAWFLLLALDIALRTLPFRKLQNWLGSPRRIRTTAKDEPVEVTIQRFSGLLERAARHHLYPMTCLRQSLALQWLLSRQGIQTELRFGVRREAGKLDAHAWLEYQGEPIGETTSPEEQFTPLKTHRGVQ